MHSVQITKLLNFTFTKQHTDDKVSIHIDNYATKQIIKHMQINNITAIKIE